LTAVLEPLAGENVGCPYCGGSAEPEQDGEMVFFVCPACDGEFGYHKAAQGSFCAAGLPLPEPAPVFVAVTIMRRPE
jgi:hypothetical protein